MLRFILFMALATATYGGSLKPNYLKPGKVVYQSDFSEAVELDNAIWQPRQGTRWSSEDGALKGTPSTPEYQAKKKASGKGHTGNIPRIYLLNTPQNFILSYRFKLEGGTPTKLVPLVEFGHHVSRVYFSEAGPKLLADHESKTLDQLNQPLKPGIWHDVLIEAKGNALSIQIDGIGTLSAKDPYLGNTERTIIGFTGNANGTIYLDDIKLSEIR